MAKNVEAKPLVQKRFILNIGQLWQERFASHLREQAYYWQIMGSGGLLFTVVVLFVLAVIYYEDFLAWMPAWLPLPFLFALILALVITRTKHRTLLKEADTLFLLPQEKQMEHYFQRANRYNMVIQSAVVAAVLLMLLPIYTHKLSTHANLFFYFLLPLYLKAWNVQSSWNALRLPDQRKRWVHTGGRLLFNFLLLYWFFSGGKVGLGLDSPSLYKVSIVVLLCFYASVAVIFYLLERGWRQRHALPWLAILEMEEGLKTRFYRFANSFVDVPNYRTRVKRKVWLSFITEVLPFHSKSTYRFLYLKTWLRSSDYFGIFVRLTLIGAVIIYLLPDQWGQVLAYVILLFMTMLQSKGLWGHHQRKFWIALYPLAQAQQKEAFSWFLRVLIIVQVFIVTLPVLFLARQIGFALIIVAVGFGFACFYPLYALRKIR